MLVSPEARQIQGQCPEALFRGPAYGQGRYIAIDSWIKELSLFYHLLSLQ